ncbi:MAG: hypothetical protein ABIR32_17735 [Ilumatobacteraceae bacterium]
MIGGMAAVVAASALLAVGLAGGPLYVSSASSEALQIAMAGTCATDVGLDLVVPAFGSSSSDDAPALSAWLDERSVEVPNAKAPVLSRATWPNYTLRGGDGLARRMVLLWRDGQLEHLDIDATLGGTIGNGRILAADQARDRAAIATGSVLDISIASALRPMPVAKTLEVAGTYRDIPFLPEPSHWCGWRASVRPSPSGDPPPLLMIADESVFDALPGEVVYTTWELRPRSNRLTVAEAESLSAGYHRVRAEFDQHLADAIAEMSEADQAFWAASLPRQAEPRIDLLIAQSRQVGTVVGRTMAPVRLAGVAADVMLLFGAAVLVARQRERELRLRLLRGDSAVMIAGRVAIGQAIPVALGTAVGAAMALLAIVTVGPTPELESGPIVTAGLSAIGGALAAIALVGGVAAAATCRTVDRQIRTRRRRIPVAPVLAGMVVGLAVLSYIRLDRVGGVRLVGAEATGGDLLAQSFPLLALAAPLTVLTLPLIRIARRSRRWGSGLPVPVVSGLRRVGAEPATSVTIAMASALAIGAFLISTAMTNSARQLLAEKSAVYLGSDEVVTVTEYRDLPAALTGTVVGRLDVRGDGPTVEVLAVDPATFAIGVRWRADASDRSLADLLSVIADPSPGVRLPAIVIGLLDIPIDGFMHTPNRREVALDPQATARWFPGQHAGTTLVIVNRDALLATDLDVAEQVWLKDPPVDATTLLADAGFNIGAVRRSADVFDVISFRAVRWSYSALTAFGVVIAAAVILAQLLVLDARRRARQANGVLSRPMGLTTGGLAVAVGTELAIPLVAGLVVGIATAVAVLHVAVPRLDTLRQLQPPARVVIDLTTMATATGAALVVLVLLTLIGVVGIRRAQPMEVMRGG